MLLGWDGEPSEGSEQRSKVNGPQPDAARGRRREMRCRKVTWTQMVGQEYDQHDAQDVFLEVESQGFAGK